MDASKLVLSLFISAFNPSIDPLVSSFTDAIFFICLTLFANFNVDSVSNPCVSEGLILATSLVLEFPPKESFNKNVSLESL